MTSAPRYVAHGRMDELHALARPHTDSPFELTFILLSQVKELLFRAVYVELDQARRHLVADQPETVARALARAVRTVRVLTAAWDAFTGMSPDEFLSFRHVLEGASGIQSPMYRRLEFIMGNRDSAALALSADTLAAYPELTRELSEPSLYDEVLRFLGRRAALPSGDDVERLWVRVYHEPDRYPVEHRLAELLTDIAYEFSRWRATHLLVVERMLGRKRGTGGTTGVEWLRQVSEHRFFPELWSARTQL
ncbi:tryptophan 2,3-dioxygenase [Nocardia africana]